MPKEKKRKSEKKSKPRTIANRSARANQPESPSTPETSASDFPVVGIGASAGGLEAFFQLLNSLPDDLDMGFVFIQHLDPKHESKLSELISRVTKMSVSQVRDADVVRPNHIYIIPPNADIELRDNSFRVLARKSGSTNGKHMPIDSFFRSLANSKKSKAIGIILSGTGSDGTLGTQEIKEQGGITFVQEEGSAKYEGMPRSAILSGYVDFILPLHEISKELKQIAKHPYISRSQKEVSKDEQNLRQIFQLLRKQKQVDFSHYKRSTLERRIMRRMAVNRISTLAEYLKLLHEKPAEVQSLFQDMLIKVTGFFRDPETFHALKTKVFPKLIAHRKEKDAIRIWIPGCATGEEAYSVAICLLEFLDKKTSFPIQVFATDVSEWAVERARSGEYVENIALDVSPQRLRRFFTKSAGGYVINKSVRDLCVFARHDITSDPPFSHMDLISCRNLLIYLDATAQRRVIPIFHYALKAAGYFALGSAESLGSYAELFTVVDKSRNIYQKKHQLNPSHFHFQLREPPFEKIQIGSKTSERMLTSHEINVEADRLILGRFAPSGVIISEDLQVVQFRGQTALYFEHTPGEASLNLMRMARGNLPIILRPLIHKAIRQNASVEKHGLEFKCDGTKKTLNIRIIPLDNLQNKAQAPYLLILFEDVSDLLKRTSKGKVLSEKEKQQQENREMTELQRELQATKEYLQAIIEEQESSNEELKSANEEIQSANEELQSTNEELETNKEELQSANEELTTLNEELQNRNAELDHVNNDLTNLFHSINIAILALENDLRIRWFTPATQRIFKVINSDVGRSITDMRSNFDFPDLEKSIHESMETLHVKEREIQDQTGHWFLLRIRPYRTKDNKIDGVVLMFVDIDTMKKAMGEIQNSRDFAEAIVKTVRQPLVIMNGNFEIVRLNEAFQNVFPFDGRNSTQNFFEFSDGRWNIPQLRKRLETLIKKSKSVEALSLKVKTQKGDRELAVDARPIYQQHQVEQLYLMAIEDVTERKQAEELAYHQTMLKEIHHRIKNNLQIISSLLHLQSNFITDKKTLEMFRESQNRVKSVALVHEKLYQSHEVSSIDFGDYVKDLAQNLQRSYGIRSDIVQIEIPIKDLEMGIDTAVPSALIVSELLSNALKYAFPEGRKGVIRIDVASAPDRERNEYHLTVKDNGIGLPANVDVKQTESLGLLLVRKLVEQLDGTLEVLRDHGTVFHLRLKEVTPRNIEVGGDDSGLDQARRSERGTYFKPRKPV